MMSIRMVGISRVGRACALPSFRTQSLHRSQLKVNLERELNKVPKRTNSQYLRRVQYSFYSNYDENNLRAFRAIIAANVFVFFNWNYGWPLSRETLHRYFTASSYGVFVQKNVVSLVGSAFSHIDFNHILANMFTFYFFGREVFLSLGPRFAVGMYLAAGALGSYAQVWMGKDSRINVTVIGASGAVSSFVVYSILQNPRATILVWFFFPVPAALFGLLYVFQDVYGLSHPQSLHGGVQVGHGAHLAGSLVGLLAWFGRRRYWI